MMTLDELIIHNNGKAKDDVCMHSLGDNDAFVVACGMGSKNPELAVRTRLGFLCSYEKWLNRSAELGFPQNSSDTED